MTAAIVVLVLLLVAATVPFRPDDVSEHRGPVSEPAEADADADAERAGFPLEYGPADAAFTPVGLHGRGAEDANDTPPLRPVALDGPATPLPDSGEPTPEEEPTHDACADRQAGAALAVTPDPHQVSPGVMDSALTIVNCSDENVDWTAATVPAVTLASDNGTLSAGSRHTLDFSIDENGFAENAFSFRIKVSEPGFNEYVDVHGSKIVLALPVPDLPDPADMDPDFTTGGPTGCAVQCITRAWLTPNATTPDLALEVETDTPAAIEVFVSESAPVFDADGRPAFPGLGPVASSADGQTGWTTGLDGLDPATTYHVIVRATDAPGGVSHRLGSFTTIEPATAATPEIAAPVAGCADQCITRAWLTPDPASFDMALEVTTHTPATLDVYVSTEAPAVDATGSPYFPGVDPIATTDGERETEWTSHLGPLDAATRYHVIVKATDSQARRSFQAGTFETRDHGGMMVTFHQVRVITDGDVSPGNRGELRFGVAVDAETVAHTDERKIHGNTTVHLNDGNRLAGISHVVPTVGDFLPTVRVAAFERDGGGAFDYCVTGNGVPTEQGRNDSCHVKWNVAASGLTSTADLDSMDRCTDLGVDGEFADDRCLRIETVAEGDDYPTFFAIVSYRPLD